MNKLLISLFLVFSFSGFSSSNLNLLKLKKTLKKEIVNKSHYKKIEKEILEAKGKSVPLLIEVMKSAKYPDRNRWLATMSLARLMGKKSLPFIRTFLNHPSWMMRLVSLKVLRMFKDTKSDQAIEKALFDKASLVRIEALDMISKRKRVGDSNKIWKMLFDKKNYYKAKKGKLQVTEVLSRVIEALGEFKDKSVSKGLAKLLQDKKYEGLASKIDLSLSKITGKKSPEANKKSYWKKQVL